MSPSKPAASAQPAFLGLGSNLGDRRANLCRAVALLGGSRATQVARLSSIYATEPVGLREQPEFLNAVAEIRTEQTPEELLKTCMAIERELGRERAVRWGPRTMDIDILLYGDLRVSGENLCLPHPRMTERAFVLVPLAEIAPDRLIDGRTAVAWAAGVDSAGVRRVDKAWTQAVFPQGGTNP